MPHRYHRASRFALSLITLAVALTLGISTVFGAAMLTVVEPAAMNGWGFALDHSFTTVEGDFAPGPATSPLGKGSAHLGVTDALGNGRVVFGTTQFKGTRLSAIESIAFYTYVAPTSGDFVAPTFQINIDYDATDANTGWQGRLVFEPYFTSTVTKGAWQQWTALDGKWWASGAPGNLTCGQNTPCTWAQVLTYWPNAGVTDDALAGAVLFKAGGGSINWANFDGYVDHFTFTLKGTPLPTEYSFDFEPPSTVYVDDDWAGLPLWQDPDGAGPAHGLGLDAFSAIQQGIDAVLPGGEVRVFPGDYSETAANRTLYNGSGPYQFGLFIGSDKTGLSITGVDASNAPVTDASATLASVETNATNSFGYSGIFVEADNVTLSGLRLLPNLPEDNKTIEVIGDAFTLQYSFLDIPAGGSVYINDWRFQQTGSNPVTGVSHVQGYTIDHNRFDYGSSVDLSSGAGFTGPASARQVTNNQFDGTNTYWGDVQSYWPLVSFNSVVPTVGWFTYPVNGAVIQNNTFSHSDQWIRVRGNDYDNATFDWAAYWNTNTFDKAVVTGPTPPAKVTEYSYTSGTYVFDHVRRIGSLIQGEVDHAQAGDTVLVKAGTYTEQVRLTQSLTLKGESGALQTTLKAPAAFPLASDPASTILLISGAGVSAEVTGLTVSGPGPSGCGSIAYGIFVRDGATANIHHNRVLDVRDQPFSGCQNGVAIMVGRQALGTTGKATITDNTISGYQKNGITISNTGSSATITGNTVTGAGPTTVIAQNGIQVSGGATASITGNTVTGHSYTPGNWVSTGLLLYYANASASGNTLTNNQVGLYHIEGSGTHDSNVLTASSAGTGTSVFWGMVVDAPPPGREPAVLEDQPAVFAGRTAVPTIQTVVISNNDLTSDGNGYGIEADGGYGSLDIDFTARNNFVRNWSEGIVISQCTSGCSTGTFINLDIKFNNLTGSSVYGAVNYGAPDADGATNWWDSQSGPAHTSNIGGTGDAVSDGITFNPWLCTGTDTAPAVTGFQPDLSKLCGLAEKLTFTTQPGGALINQAFNPQPVVTVQDASGNLAVNYNGPVTLVIASNPNSGTLAGTLTVNAVNGVATFSGLSIDRAGAGYTLLASAASLTQATSASFTISNPVPVLTSIQQTWVRHGSPAFLLTLTGSQFVYNAEARWNGTPLVVVSNTGNELIAVVPVGLVANVGTASITAFNPGPGGGTSATQTFSIVNVVDVKVTKTDNQASALGGSTVTYVVTVTNAGPDAVTGGSVTDNVPGLLSGVTWTCSASAGSSCAASGSGNALTDTVNIASGGTLVYTISGRLPNQVGGVLTNTAALTLPALTVDLTAYDLSATDTTLLAPLFVYHLPLIGK